MRRYLMSSSLSWKYFHSTLITNVYLLQQVQCLSPTVNRFEVISFYCLYHNYSGHTFQLWLDFHPVLNWLCTYHFLTSSQCPFQFHSNTEKLYHSWVKSIYQTANRKRSLRRINNQTIREVCMTKSHQRLLQIESHSLSIGWFSTSAVHAHH